MLRLRSQASKQVLPRRTRGLQVLCMLLLHRAVRCWLRVWLGRENALPLPHASLGVQLRGTGRGLYARMHAQDVVAAKHAAWQRASAIACAARMLQRRLQRLPKLRLQRGLAELRLQRGLAELWLCGL